MKFLSWNVNGFKACLGKGFMDFFGTVSADFFCIQETKIQEENCNFEFAGYEQYWNYCERKGYSGTAIFTKHQPLSVAYGFGQFEEDENRVQLSTESRNSSDANCVSSFSTGMGHYDLDREGRLITLEYDNFYLLNVYTPNSKHGAVRLDFRMDWDEAFKEYAKKLNNRKPLIICGDMNVAHREIDCKQSQNLTVSPGFTEEEQEEFTNLLQFVGLKDSFRHLNPNKTEAYTWWSYRHQKRNENSGFRIDYFLISDYLTQFLNNSYMLPDVQGSDHCPIALELFD